MAKNTEQEIIELGFKSEMFGKKNDVEFSEFLLSILSEQAIILEGRIGTTAYSSTTSPTKDYVKRAEKCLTAAELIQRRINVILGNVAGAGQEIDVSHEGAQKKVYINEANDLIAKIIGGVGADTNDFASGVLITSHFDE